MDQLINANIPNNKKGLLEYYRYRASEIISEANQRYANSEYRKRASFVNKSIIETRSNLIQSLEQIAEDESWDKQTVLESILMLNYTNYIVMLESRHNVWPYEYMTFSRRVGELWEPFVKLCWQNPILNDVKFFTPPLFRDVKDKLISEIKDFIDTLNISQAEKVDLMNYYSKVWSLVTSGEIRLELDLHFKNVSGMYVVDFKSGFSSNEKGNTNRLLLVASIYKVLDQGHKCLIFVRSEEDRNNHYLQTLKNSDLWDVYSGKETYKQVEKFTGFNYQQWYEKSVDWKGDISSEMYTFLNKNDLTHYLEW